MDEDDFDKLYLISYLISNRESDEVEGYAELASRLQYLKELIIDDDRLDEEFREEIRDLIFVEEDHTLDWTGLKDLIERAKGDDHGSMFLDVGSISTGPNEWKYVFYSKAPQELLENKFDDMIDSENKTRFLEKVRSAAEIGRDEVIEEVYST